MTANVMSPLVSCQRVLASLLASRWCHLRLQVKCVCVCGGGAALFIVLPVDLQVANLLRIFLVCNDQGPFTTTTIIDFYHEFTMTKTVDQLKSLVELHL